MNDKIKILETLTTFSHLSEQFDTRLFVMALLAALAASLWTAGLYRFFYERRGTGSQVHRAFPLLGIAITTLFIGVQLSIPLSLGLLGSLSIIRFRTPIKEPEEVGFIMLVIASSISAATFNFHFMIWMHATALLALLIARASRGWRWARRDGLLVLALSTDEARGNMRGVEECLAGNLRSYCLENSFCADGDSTYKYSFRGLKTSVPDLQAALDGCARLKSLNILFDRPGGIL